MPNSQTRAYRLVGTFAAAALFCMVVGAAARQTTGKPPQGGKAASGDATTRKGQLAQVPAPDQRSDKPNALKLKPMNDPQADDLDHFSGYNAIWDINTKIETADNFTYRSKDTVITGAKVRHNTKLKILDAEGKLALDDPKHHMTGDKAHVEEDKKLAVFDGNVMLVMKPEETAADSGANKEPDKGKEDQDVGVEKKFGGVVNCDHVEYYYSTKRKFSILKGHLVFTQHKKNSDGTFLDRTITAEHAEYDGVKEQLRLFKPVAGHDSDGQDFDTDGDVIVFTKEGEEKVQFLGPANFRAKHQEENTDEETPTAPPAKSGKEKGG